MRRRYWIVEGAIGAFLVLAPFVEGFARQQGPLYPDLIAGVVLIVWATVGYPYFRFLFEGL